MRLNAANILRAAAMQAFPTKPEKWVKFHDTRHSYAIELGQAGVSLFQISQQLGILERTCARHYLGFLSSAETTEMIESKISERNRIRNSR
jgi:integrase